MDEWQRLLAPAKLTVSLRVTGLRADGLHLIDAEMVTLNLADEILIRDAPRSVLSIQTTSAGFEVASNPDNLVFKALRLAGRNAEVRLTKHIAAGAGLGGGSADAAAVLRWAGFDDVVAAAEIGADVSFCLRGGRARVRGIGELLEPLERVRESFTLLTPPFGVSTPAVYAAWDELGGPRDPHNDLTAAALHIEPRLAEWRDLFANATQQQPVLAGSGGTWFVKGTHHGVSVKGVDATIAVTLTDRDDLSAEHGEGLVT